MTLATCDRCKRQSPTVGERRTNTRYADDRKNFEHTCLPCFEERQGWWESQVDYLRGPL